MGEKILVIEDERTIQGVVRAYLEREGYEVSSAESGTEGLAMVEEQEPDLVILDLNLPGMNGLEVARRIRAQDHTYILMLTARAEEEDRVRGLRQGADDYLTKPFSPRELVARVEALLRRQRRQRRATRRLKFEHTSLDVDRHEAQAGQQRLDLTPTEFKLLNTLMDRPGEVRSREELLREVWGPSYYGNDRVVDVYVGQVRRKLEEAAGLTLIETVRGVGYKFIDREV